MEKIKWTWKKVLATIAAVLGIGTIVSCYGMPANYIDDEDPEIPLVPYPPAPKLAPVTDSIGKESKNLVYDGDADEGQSDEHPQVGVVWENGVTVSRDDGGANGKCWRVTQNNEDKLWQELAIDLTILYGRGKSYLVSFKVKADPEAGELKSLGHPVNLYYSVYSGDLRKWAIDNDLECFDWDENYLTPWIINPYSGKFTDETFNTIRVGDNKLTDEWIEYKYVIPASEIDRIVNNSGLYQFWLAIHMGDRGEGGYSYLIDDLTIKDLNTEIKQTGATWKDPVEENQDETME